MSRLRLVIVVAIGARMGSDGKVEETNTRFYFLSRYVARRGGWPWIWTNVGPNTCVCGNSGRTSSVVSDRWSSICMRPDTLRAGTNEAGQCEYPSNSWWKLGGSSGGRCGGRIRITHSPGSMADGEGKRHTHLRPDWRRIRSHRTRHPVSPTSRLGEGRAGPQPADNRPRCSSGVRLGARAMKLWPSMLRIRRRHRRRRRRHCVRASSAASSSSTLRVDVVIVGMARARAPPGDRIARRRAVQAIGVAHGSEAASRRRRRPAPRAAG